MGGRHASALRRGALVFLAAALVGAGPGWLPGPAYAAEQLTISPTRGLDGTSISVVPAFKTESTCQLMWDTTVASESFDCGGTAPPTNQQAVGTPGTHQITVCQGSCSGPKAVATEVADFVVQTTVPDLTNRSLNGPGGAFELLKDADLVMGSESGPIRASRAVVVHQDPSSGTVVDPRSSVDIAVAVPSRSGSATTPAPRADRIVVPDVRKLSLKDARRELAGVRLRLEVASPHAAGTVRTQRPRPGTSVLRGSAVHVTITSAVPPPPPPASRDDPAVPAPVVIAVSITVLFAAAFAALRLIRRPRLRARARVRASPPVRAQVIRAVLPGDVAVQITGQPIAPTIEFRCSRESSVEVHS